MDVSKHSRNGTRSTSSGSPDAAVLVLAGDGAADTSSTAAGAAGQSKDVAAAGATGD